MSNNKRTKVYIIIIIIMIILVDQITKIIMINNNSKTVGNIFLGYNAEEKMETDSAIMSVLTDSVVFIIIIKFLKEQSKNMDKKVKVSLACILGGGMSNIIDKIWNRDVIEFIKIGSLPTLNVAYIILLIAWIVFIMLMVKNTMKVKEEIQQIDEQRRAIGREKK